MNPQPLTLEETRGYRYFPGHVYGSHVFAEWTAPADPITTPRPLRTYTYPNLAM